MMDFMLEPNPSLAKLEFGVVLSEASIVSQAALQDKREQEWIRQNERDAREISDIAQCLAPKTVRNPLALHFGAQCRAFINQAW